MQQYVYLLHEGANGLTQLMHGAAPNLLRTSVELPLRLPLTLRNSWPQSLVTAAEPCYSRRSEQGPPAPFSQALPKPAISASAPVLHPQRLFQTFDIEFQESPTLEIVAAWSRGSYSNFKKPVYKN
jgi:hypothetical protein